MSKIARSILDKNKIMNLYSALHSMHPELDEAELEKIGDQILIRLSDYLRQGYLPAMAKTNDDGSLELIVLSFEEKKDG